MNKLRKLFLTVLTLSVILLSGCAGNQEADRTEEFAAPETVDEATSKMESASVPDTVDETAPEDEPSASQISFEAVDTEGNAVTSDIFSQSKLTMINVWATYCNPCLSEMPGLGELAAEYDAKKFHIIGIVSDVLEGEDQELAENLIEETGADYTHLLLNESLYYALLTDVSAVPTTFFIDENGTVLDTVVGANEKSAWEEMINGLLEEL